MASDRRITFHQLLPILTNVASEDIPEINFRLILQKFPPSWCVRWLPPMIINTQTSSGSRTGIYTMPAQTVRVKRHSIHRAKEQFFTELPNWWHTTSAHPLASRHPCNPHLTSVSLFTVILSLVCPKQALLSLALAAFLFVRTMHIHITITKFCALYLQLLSAGSQPGNSVLLFKYQLESKLPTNKQYLKSL